MSFIPIDSGINGFSGFGVKFIVSTIFRIGLIVANARGDARIDQSLDSVIVNDSLELVKFLLSNSFDIGGVGDDGKPFVIENGIDDAVVTVDSIMIIIFHKTKQKKKIRCTF